MMLCFLRSLGLITTSHTVKKSLDRMPRVGLLLILANRMDSKELNPRVDFVF